MWNWRLPSLKLVRIQSASVMSARLGSVAARHALSFDSRWSFNSQ